MAKIENETLRVRAKLNDDFGGDKTKWLNKTTDTSNMLSVLSETCGPVIYGIMQLSESLDKEVNAVTIAKKGLDFVLMFKGCNRSPYL